jgi:hypothetical protein
MIMSIGFGAQLYWAGEEFLVRTALVLRVIHAIHRALLHQSLVPTPATPAKAGAYGSRGSRLSPGKQGEGGLNQLYGSER